MCITVCVMRTPMYTFRSSIYNGIEISYNTYMYARFVGAAGVCSLYISQNQELGVSSYHCCLTLSNRWTLCASLSWARLKLKPLRSDLQLEWFIIRMNENASSLLSLFATYIEPRYFIPTTETHSVAWTYNSENKETRYFNEEMVPRILPK